MTPVDLVWGALILTLKYPDPYINWDSNPDPVKGT